MRDGHSRLGFAPEIHFTYRLIEGTTMTLHHLIGHRLLWAICIVALPLCCQEATAQRSINPVVRTFRYAPHQTRPALVYGEQPTHGELVCVYDDPAPPAEFCRENRCVVGRWVFNRKIVGGYFGYLEYANANDDSVGVRERSGPYRVRVPEGVEFDLGVKEARWSDVVILKDDGDTWHSLVAHSGAAGEDQRTITRLVANSSGPHWGADEFAYRGNDE